MRKPEQTYFLIYGLLLILLAATVWLAQIDLGRWNAVAALLIAGMKASLVVIYFMHVRERSGLTKLIAFAGFFWLSILIALTLSDFLTRNWLASSLLFGFNLGFRFLRI